MYGWVRGVAHTGREAGLAMANIIAATESMTFRRALADVLAAADHNAETASESVLTLAALHLSERRSMALLGEMVREHEIEGRDALDMLASDETCAPWLAAKAGSLHHAYILLTELPPDELPPALRALRTYGRAALLDPNCSAASLLAALELSIERFAQNEAARAQEAVTSSQ